MTKFSKIKVCDSKIKYSTEIAVQYVIEETGTNLSQDYYNRMSKISLVTSRRNQV